MKMKVRIARLKRLPHTIKMHFIVLRIIGFRAWFIQLFEPKPLDISKRPNNIESSVHSMFGLSYASYFVVPRIVLVNMPNWWQAAFCFLMKYLPDTPEYTVQRRDDKGHFIKDDFANYRRGDIEQIMRDYGHH